MIASMVSCFGRSAGARSTTSPVRKYRGSMLTSSFLDRIRHDRSLSFVPCGTTQDQNNPLPNHPTTVPSMHRANCLGPLWHKADMHSCSRNVRFWG